MKMKNRFMATCLYSGLATFGSINSFAAQTCQEVPGALRLVSVKSATNDDFGHNALKRELRAMLDEEARMICSEAEFCFEDTSIKTTFSFNTWTKVLHGTMTAVVNCLE